MFVEINRKGEQIIFIARNYPVQIRMNKGYVVVAGDNVSKSRESLLNTLDLYGIWQGVSYVLELNIGRRARDQQSIFVSCQL